MNRPATLALSAAMAVAGAAPAMAQTAHHKPKPIKGTWTYTDVTPDPTVIANSDATAHCHGKIPAAPTDVNAHTLKVPAAGTLTVVGHNRLDWAMEVRDRRGNVLAGSDGSSPVSAEGTTVALAKGTYSVVYCSAEGEPTITVDYTFVFR